MTDDDYVLLVGGDLLGTDRILTAARAAGLGFDKTSVAGLAAAIASRHPAIVVVDLDGGREEAVRKVGELTRAGRLSGRVIGYYSHVDAPLAAAAKEAGIDAMPRGRLWRSLDELFATRPG